MKLKALQNKSDFSYDSNHAFFRFCKRYDECKGMSLNSGHNKMKEFNKLLICFKNFKRKNTEIELKKERSMKSIDELYKNYYNPYKSNFGELTEDKKKKFNYEQFELDNQISKESKLRLPKWTKVSEKRFNEILNTITEAKNNRLRANINGKEITLDKAENLLKDIASGKINGHEFKEKYNDIVNDVTLVLDKAKPTKNQNNIVEILLLLTEIFKPRDNKIDEKPDTTDMPELESEESAEQRRNQSGEDLKILTPNQMLSRLPIS